MWVLNLYTEIVISNVKHFCDKLIEKHQQKNIDLINLINKKNMQSY